MSDPTGVSVAEFRKVAKKIEREALEEAMALQIEEEGLPPPVRQHPHVPGRAYRLDFAWPEQRIGLEVDGGIGKGLPSHSSATGIIRDIEKHNLGALAGWTVLRAHTKMVKSGEAARLVRSLFQERGLL